MMHYDAQRKVLFHGSGGKIWRLTIDFLFKVMGRGENQIAQVLIANSQDVIAHNESLRQTAAATE